MTAAGKRSSQRPPVVPGEGVRLDWESLPDNVREVIEGHLKTPVRRVEVQRGGFSPAFAGILTTEDGKEIFVKAGGTDPNPDVPKIYRREWAIASALPSEVPAPQALWFEDDGRWVVLAFEAVRGGNPRLPWRKADLDRVVRALEGMTRTLTPSPVAPGTVAERLAWVFRGFRTLRAEALDSAEMHRSLDPWVDRHLAQLADWESDWEQLTRGPTLLHSDVRADNIVLGKKQVYFVDWPWACVGPAWVELVGFLPSVAMQGGPKPWEVFDRSPLAKDAPPKAVRAFLTAFTGYLVKQSSLPAPPGLPTLREFQRVQGVEALGWLRALTPELR
jgi:aminoglycoside phosphotransferase (APT) family kinase protein